MKNIKYIFTIIVLNVMLPVIIYADCESDFKKVEKDFSVSYEYNEDTDDFTITLVSPDRTKYTFGFSDPDDVKDAYWTNNENKRITTIKKYKKSEYKYMLLGTYGDCKDYIAKEGTLSLSKDNMEVTNEDTIKEKTEEHNNTSNTITNYYKENKVESLIMVIIVAGGILGFAVYIIKNKSRRLE